MEEKRTFCSSCKHSRYVLKESGKKYLLCELRKAFGQNSLLPTDSTLAEDCLEYKPERKEDAMLDEKSYIQALRHCRIRADAPQIKN